MSANNSTHAASAGKPAKPRPNFALFAHNNGQWCKKIRGKLVYFGPWSDPDGAEKKYLDQKDDLHAGRKPRTDSAALTVKEAANAFMNAKKELVEAGELSARTFADYKEVAQLVVRHLGGSRAVSDVRPDDFGPLRNKMAKRWGPHRLNKLIQYTRSIFKHAYDAELIAAPVRFGPAFKRPSKKVIRLNRAENGPRLFTPEEIRKMLDASGVQLRAMILLGINCGFGNADCGQLPLSALDLDSGWLNFPRPKTGIARRAPLWAETVQALRNAIAERPAPKDPADAGLVFITTHGGSWCKDTSANPISHEMAKLLRSLRIGGRRNFYVLRHSFRTVADAVRDQPAADHIMGHELAHMSAVYREHIADDRLRAVVEHVRTWLYAKPAAGPTEMPAPLSEAV